MKTIVILLISFALSGISYSQNLSVSSEFATKSALQLESFSTNQLFGFGVENNTGDLIIKANGAIGTEVMRITDDDGFMGIGTSDPFVDLHVDGLGSKCVIGNHLGVLAKFTVNAEVGTDVVRFRTDGTTKMIIKSNGNVGIGTSIPDADLDVDGDFYVGDISDDNFMVDGANDRVGVFTNTPDYTFEIEHDLGSPGASSGNGLNIKNKSGTVGEHWTIYNLSSGDLQLFQGGE